MKHFFFSPWPQDKLDSNCLQQVLKKYQKKYSNKKLNKGGESHQDVVIIGDKLSKTKPLMLVGMDDVLIIGGHGNPEKKVISPKLDSTDSLTMADLAELLANNGLTKVIKRIKLMSCFGAGVLERDEFWLKGLASDINEGRKIDKKEFSVEERLNSLLENDGDLEKMKKEYLAMADRILNGDPMAKALASALGKAGFTQVHVGGYKGEVRKTEVKRGSTQVVESFVKASAVKKDKNLVYSFTNSEKKKSIFDTSSNIERAKVVIYYDTFGNIV